MHLVDEAFLGCPLYHSRQLMRHLHRRGHHVDRNRVARLLREMELRACALTRSGVPDITYIQCGRAFC